MQNKKTKLKRNKKKKKENIYIFLKYGRSMLPIKLDEWNKFTIKNSVLNTYTKTSFSAYNGIIGFCLLL